MSVEEFKLAKIDSICDLIKYYNELHVDLPHSLAIVVSEQDDIVDLLKTAIQQDIKYIYKNNRNIDGLVQLLLVYDKERSSNTELQRFVNDPLFDKNLLREIGKFTCELSLYISMVVIFLKNSLKILNSL